MQVGKTTFSLQCTYVHTYVWASNKVDLATHLPHTCYTCHTLWYAMKGEYKYIHFTGVGTLHRSPFGVIYYSALSGTEQC